MSGSVYFWVSDGVSMAADASDRKALRYKQTLVSVPLVSSPFSMFTTPKAACQASSDTFSSMPMCLLWFCLTFHPPVLETATVTLRKVS